MSVDATDLYKVLETYVSNKMLVAHNIESFDEFANVGLPDIISNLFKIDHVINHIGDQVHTYKKKPIKRTLIKITFSNAKFNDPDYTTVVTNNKVTSIPMIPYLARHHSKTYSAKITVDVTTVVTYEFVDERIPNHVETVLEPGFSIGSLPIMVKSTLCALRKDPTISKRDFYMLHREDPNDEGGYFIIGGNEWSIDSSESSVFNYPQVYNNNHRIEMTRLEIITKQGDSFSNSRQVVIPLYNNDSIGVRLIGNNDFIKVDGLDGKFELPMQWVYRVLGVETDRDIIAMILGVNRAFTYEGLSNINKEMYGKLIKALTAPIKKPSDIPTPYDEADSDRLALWIGKRYLKVAQASTTQLTSGIVIRSDEDIVNTLRNSIDSSIALHIRTDDTTEPRIKKLMYFSYLVRKLLCTNLGIFKESQRDAYDAKRLHAPGISCSKTFKNVFRSTIIKDIRSKLSDSFSNKLAKDDIIIPNILKAIKTDDLRDAFETSIKTATKDIDGTAKKSISSQNLARKNTTNVYSVLRNIHTHNPVSGAKSKRNIDMRSVHPTYTGYICPIASADTGEKVGLSKQIAITCKVTMASSSHQLKLVIDDLVEKKIGDIWFTNGYLDLSNIDEEAYAKTKVLVNGDIIGTVSDVHGFLRKARQLRTEGAIDKYATIAMHEETNEIHLWTDMGRLVRPLIKVYDNMPEFLASHRAKKPIPFKQYIRLTKQHATDFAAKKINMDDLWAQGIVEFISVEESKNCHISQDWATFDNHASDYLCPFTHVDIPQSIFGLSALTSPFLNHTMSTRCTYQTNQGKQANGIYSLVPHHRFDRKRAQQIPIENPIVRTLANNVVYPNGQNLIVAVMIHEGFNQEDSTVINRTAIERGGVLDCMFYSTETILISGVDGTIGIPPTAQELNKSDLSFLDERGIIRQGSVIPPHTVLVSKYSETGDKHIDKSVIHRTNETIEIDEVDVMYTSGSSVIESISIRFKSHRPLIKGDKLSTRSGNKNIISDIKAPSEMPYIESTGVIPDMVVNPQSIPTRMVIGQLIEALASRQAIERMDGKSIDGTAFNRVDIDATFANLKEMDVDQYSTDYMVCGATGRRIKAKIFVSPLFIQRLQKFAIDEQYVTTKGHIDEVTKQAVNGRAQAGGLKIGEMENWSLASHSTSSAMTEKVLMGTDAITAYVCKNCRNSVAYVTSAGVTYCPVCKSNSNIVSIETSRPTMILDSFNKVLGINTTYNTDV